MAARKKWDPAESQRGLECPRCGCRHFHVLYTRALPGGRILRRRQCRYCGARVSTYEQEIEREPKDGQPDDGCVDGPR